jgi:hypothetical protein
MSLPSFPNRSVRYNSNESASHMLLLFGIDWYMIGNANTTKATVSCIRCLLYSVLHFFAGSPIAHWNLLRYGSRVEQSITYFRCFVVRQIRTYFKQKLRTIIGGYICSKVTDWHYRTLEPGIIAKIQLQSFIILGVRWRRVVSFTPRSIYPWIKNHQESLSIL